MNQPLNGKKVAILVTDDFEQAELASPKEALETAGVTVHILSDKSGEVQGMNHDEKADLFVIDGAIEDADPSAYDAVLLPGGVVNADAIRMNQRARAFVQAMDRSGKPLAVICHGSWLLISAGLIKGRTLTAWPSLQDDIRNAGGEWLDQEVVRDGNWVSSRKPDDLPAFNQAFLELLGSEQTERKAA
ncbi:MAG: type 1 glutamine amidotransferase domain-containing protein [Burkholderiaceae bacterium]